MDICGRDDRIFLLFTRFCAENWTTAFFFALHLMHNCIYVCLMTSNIGSGKFGYVGLQSG